MLITIICSIAGLVVGLLLGAFLAGRVWSYLVRASQRQFKDMAQAFDELKATADKLLEQRGAAWQERREAQQRVVELQDEIQRVGEEKKVLVSRAIRLVRESGELAAVLREIDNDPFSSVLELQKKARVAVKRHDAFHSTTLPEHPAITS